MRGYQWYFFILKSAVLLQLVFTALNFRVKDSPLFALVDTVFKISLGLFLGIYFWLFTPKGLDFEDGIIISIGGFLILTEIEFPPVVALYGLREDSVKWIATTFKNE
jgi:hypothetical protein